MFFFFFCFVFVLIKTDFACLQTVFNYFWSFSVFFLLLFHVGSIWHLLVQLRGGGLLSFHANFYGGGGGKCAGGGLCPTFAFQGGWTGGPFSLLPPLFSFLTSIFSLLPNFVSFLPPLLFSFLPATFSFLPPPLSFLPPILSFFPPPLSLLLPHFSLNPVRPYIPVKKSVCANRPRRNFLSFFFFFVFVCVSFDGIFC